MQPSSESSPQSAEENDAGGGAEANHPRLLRSAMLRHRSFAGPQVDGGGPQHGVSSRHGTVDGGRLDTDASPPWHRSLTALAQVSPEASEQPVLRMGLSWPRTGCYCFV
jgi:hypothetical protein